MYSISAKTEVYGGVPIRLQQMPVAESCMDKTIYFFFISALKKTLVAIISALPRCKSGEKSWNILV